MPTSQVGNFCAFACFAGITHLIFMRWKFGAGAQEKIKCQCARVNSIHYLCSLFFVFILELKLTFIHHYRHHTLVCLTIHVLCMCLCGGTQVRVKYVIVSLKKIIQLNSRFLSTLHTFRLAFVLSRLIFHREALTPIRIISVSILFNLIWFDMIDDQSIDQLIFLLTHHLSWAMNPSRITLIGLWEFLTSHQLSSKRAWKKQTQVHSVDL